MQGSIMTGAQLQRPSLAPKCVPSRASVPAWNLGRNAVIKQSCSQSLPARRQCLAISASLNQQSGADAGKRCLVLRIPNTFESDR